MVDKYKNIIKILKKKKVDKVTIGHHALSSGYSQWFDNPIKFYTETSIYVDYGKKVILLTSKETAESQEQANIKLGKSLETLVSKIGDAGIQISDKSDLPLLIKTLYKSAEIETK